MQSQQLLNDATYCGSDLIDGQVCIYDAAPARIVACNLKQCAADRCKITCLFRGVMALVATQLAAVYGHVRWQVKHNCYIWEGGSYDNGAGGLKQWTKIRLRHRHLESGGGVQKSVGHDPGSGGQSWPNDVLDVVIASSADQKQLLRWVQRAVRPRQDRSHLRT